MLVGKVALHSAGVRKDIQCATVIIDGTKELGAVDNNPYSFKVERRTLVHPHVGRLPQRNADAARLTWLYGDGTVLDRAHRRAEVNDPISRKSPNCYGVVPIASRAIRWEWLLFFVMRNNGLAKIASEGNGNVCWIRHGDIGCTGDYRLRRPKRQQKTKQRGQAREFQERLPVSALIHTFPRFIPNKRNSVKHDKRLLSKNKAKICQRAEITARQV
jgi:hypothetical protein